MVSRDPADLHPALREAWEWLRDEYQAQYWNSPVPRLSCTFRGREEQEAAVENGTSNAGWLESLHNFQPALAFDVYFDDNGKAVWDWVHFQRFGELAESIGLVWGGRWVNLRDGPHVQLDVTLEEARAGILPVDAMPRIPAAAEPTEPAYAGIVFQGFTLKERLVFSLAVLFQARIDNPITPVGNELVLRRPP